MAASVSRPSPQPERFGRLWWLPANGEGNGLSDTAWAPMAVVDAAMVSALLAELRAADVPAYAALLRERPPRPQPPRPPRPRWPPRLRRSRRETQIRHEQRYHVWVGTSAYSRAEETLRVKLPGLLSQHSAGSGSARAGGGRAEGPSDSA